MKIGMMLPATYAIGNPFNGVREQALAQAGALEDMGHAVIRMSSWEKYDLKSLDVVHYFFGGHWMNNIETMPSGSNSIRVFSPILDTTQSNLSYRISTKLGSISSKFITLQAQYRRQANNADVVVVRSSFEADKVQNGLGIPDSKIRMALNGCPAPENNVDTNTAREFLGFNDDFVLHISRFTNRSKNVLNMIHGVGSLGLPLVIAGTYEENGYYKEMLQAVERYPSVTIIGPVSDEMRSSLYASCKVFCLPSVREGTGLVALEAASYGANVVITSAGGPPDYFKNHAVYTEGDTPDKVGSAVTEAWGRGDNNGGLKSHVIDKLNWRTSAEQLDKIYKEFL